MDKKYRRNIAVSYLFRFLSSLALGDGIWVLYLLRKGLTLWQIGLLEGVFHIAGLISEVPSGALADLFGRKGAMLASRVLAAASTLVTIYADSMGPLAVSFVLNAWSYNLLSGSDEALLYAAFCAWTGSGSTFTPPAAWAWRRRSPRPPACWRAGCWQEDPTRCAIWSARAYRPSHSSRACS